jgi:methyltransferase-like protein
MRLIGRWPEAIAFDELCRDALGDARPFLSGSSIDEVGRDMADDLFGAVMYGLIELHTRPPACTATPSERPRAYAVAAHQAQRGTIVVNTHHEMLDLDPMSRAVLREADGERDVHTMLERLLEHVKNGTLTVNIEDGDAAGEATVRDTLGKEMERALSVLTRSALMMD